MNVGCDILVSLINPLSQVLLLWWGNYYLKNEYFNENAFICVNSCLFVDLLLDFFKARPKACRNRVDKYHFFQYVILQCPL